MSGREWGKGIVAGLCSVMLLAGCMSQPPSASKEEPKTSEGPSSVTLKVAFPNEEQFMKEYGRAFQAMYPHVTFDVIPTMGPLKVGAVEMLDIATVMAQKPDIVNGTTLVKEQVKQGTLVDLGLLFKQNNVDTSGISDVMLESFKQIGNGRLLVMAPSFQAAALYYNKDLFDRYNVPYPENGMSWQQVLQLAKDIRAAGREDGVYGMHSTILTFTSEFTVMAGVEPYNEQTREPQFDSNAYIEAMAQAVEAYQSGVLYLKPEQAAPVTSATEMLRANPFVAGKAAMMLESPRLITDLQNAKQHGISDFAWSIVAEPVHRNAPAHTRTLVADVFGITMESKQKEVALDFIRFLTSPELVAQLQKTRPYVLSVRKEGSSTMGGHTLEPFYASRPSEIIKDSWFSPQTGSRIYAISTEEVNAILYGRKSAADGMKAMQDRVKEAILAGN